MYFSQECINNVIFDCTLRLLRAQGERRCSGRTVYGLTDHATLQSGASEYSHVSVHPEPVEGVKHGWNDILS